MSTPYADLRARLAQVDALISEQQSRLKELEETRSAILTQLDGATYPVLTLPNEVTSQVFVHCLPSNLSGRREFSNFNPCPTQAPLLLLQICRAWRSIAISTPHLWDSLHLDFDRLPMLFRPSSDSMMKFIDAYLSRAGCRLLSLAIYGSELGREELVSSVICAALPCYAPRLRGLALHLEIDDFERIVDIGPFPFLEKLAVGLPFGDELHINNPNLNIKGLIADSPRLTQLTLSEDISPSTCLEFPWRQLTRFTCEYLNGDEVLNLLCQAKSLVECACSVQYGHRILHNEVVAHGCLRSLRLVNPSATDFLQFLRLPVLQHLHLSLDVIDEEATDPSMDSDADSNDDHFPLSFTGVTESSGAAAASVGWLSLVPGLTTLEVSRPNAMFLRDFIPKLDRTSAKNKLFLPHLRTLAFLDCSTAVTVPLIQALSSRSTEHTATTRLESFRQTSRISISLQGPVVGALRGLVTNGMKVHVGSASTNRL
ncbi:hypothetical protein DFH09DRAFT_1177106 [Mycena vulgaris]|nr:hypothetical protein DFH09DRAFT_1177106 [Mycena vulgaris]